ncbi:MAG: putative alpha-L-arabinofuranosidase [Phycisphaerales bacterium]|nr:putative alpha-L-arabinofuranosidase [Phycisphaerales bacterium]
MNTSFPRHASRLVRAVLTLAAIASVATAPALAADVTIRLHSDEVIPRPAGPLRSGVCLEDVNHEVYGGIYSQMIFGESFQEPANAPGPDGFRVLGGAWRAGAGVLSVDGADGDKCISDAAPLADGTVAVQMKFDDRNGENAGLVLRVSRPQKGADAFAGDEISVDAARQIVRVARHNNDYRLLKDAPAAIPVGEWFALEAKLTGGRIAVSVAGKPATTVDENAPFAAGAVGLRAWRKRASFRDLTVDRGTGRQPLPFIGAVARAGPVSGMWRPVVNGTAVAGYALPADAAFLGTQSQRMDFKSGAGQVGVENRGLNRQGLCFRANQPYDGCVWAKAEAATQLTAALESADGKTYAEQTLELAAGEWRKLDLNLTPSADDAHGRFTLKLKQPGAVTLGYAFLQPGEWGRFKGLPVRKDVVLGLLDQRVGLMRYGGSMVNDDHYRWKQMIGPRDRRPPYHGNWYPYSTNGFGIIDFLNLAEAMGIEGIPDLSANETPQDISDFIEYVNGPADSEWGRRRAADGHPAPYHLKHIQLGNEEKVDEAFARKFNALAEVVWAKDAALIPIAGDFSYHDPIADPGHVTRADGGNHNLNGQRDILRFAKQHDREVWFDIHIWSEGLEPSDGLRAAPTYLDAMAKLAKIAGGAKYQVICFELNANSHGIGRALANAMSTNIIRRDGRLPIVVSANALQVDGQNDNGWNQGLLFLDPASVWLQPPGLVMQMQADALAHDLIKTDVSGAGSAKLDVTASRSPDSKTLTVEIVNPGEATSLHIDLRTFKPTQPEADVTELSGDLRAANTAVCPDAVRPHQDKWPFATADRPLPARSLTVIRFQ